MHTEKTKKSNKGRLFAMTASLHNLGCKVNQYETSALGQMLSDAGARLVPFGEKSDICVINTCSVTSTADQKSRQMISRARRINPDGIIVAAGCYVQTERDFSAKDLGADILIGNNEKHRLIELITGFLETRRTFLVRCDDTNEIKEYENLSFTAASRHTRAFVKVEDGCNDFCSYCIIPYARGRVRSRSIEDAVAEAKELSVAGYKELVISGIHLPSFGKDTGESLIDLLAAINEIDKIERIRLGSLEPGVITEDFVSKLCKLEKVMPHFHLSLQSGCDATLIRMNRKYTTEAFRKKCSLLREFYDEPALTTDLIAGFPGETDEEFEQTFRFVSEIAFYEMHVFKYSRRSGTLADRMQDQVDERTKNERSRRLIELSGQMSSSFIQKKSRMPGSILLEEEYTKDGVDGWIGFTEHYIKTFVPGPHERGEIVKTSAVSMALS